jgi:hypothetical protein
MRPGGVIRGKERILDGKEDDSELQGGSPRLCRLRPASVEP